MSCKCSGGWHTPENNKRAKTDACKSCPSLRRLHKGLPENADIGLLDRCGECGCLIRAKAALPGQSCPLGKW